MDENTFTAKLTANSELAVSLDFILNRTIMKLNVATTLSHLCRWPGNSLVLLWMGAK